MHRRATNRNRTSPAVPQVTGDVPMLVGPDTPPTRYADVTVGDTITFGPLTSAWVIREVRGLYLDVECVSNPDPAGVGVTQTIRQGKTPIWSLSS